MAIPASTLTQRLGEPAMMAVIENWERSVGMLPDTEQPLHSRWLYMMHSRRTSRHGT
ncbi:MAG: hypothetical protein KBA75_00535 [Alphaproteobacteria bacterium]|nr:hypothetical protein [Alphaproteobacteria bacterium]